MLLGSEESSRSSEAQRKDSRYEQFADNLAGQPGRLFFGPTDNARRKKYVACPHRRCSAFIRGTARQTGPGNHKIGRHQDWGSNGETID